MFRQLKLHANHIDLLTVSNLLVSSSSMPAISYNIQLLLAIDQVEERIAGL